MLSPTRCPARALAVCYFSIETPGVPMMTRSTKALPNPRGSGQRDGQNNRRGAASVSRQPNLERSSIFMWGSQSWLQPAFQPASGAPAIEVAGVFQIQNWVRLSDSSRKCIHVLADHPAQPAEKQKCQCTPRRKRTKSRIPQITHLRRGGRHQCRRCQRQENDHTGKQNGA